MEQLTKYEISFQWALIDMQFKKLSLNLERNNLFRNEDNMKNIKMGLI